MNTKHFLKPYKELRKIVLITGANGMLAKKLGKQLAQEYTVRYLTRKVSRDNEYEWNIEKKFIDPDALKNVYSIVHIAGANISEGRWTKKRKEVIIASRVASAKLILATLQENNLRINAFISASATGYYGTKTSVNIFTEESPNGTDFLSNVCYQWEQAALAFTASNVATRTVILRIGVILAKEGGFLKKIISPIQYGLGSGIGSNKQIVPWIHIEDLCGLFKYVLDKPKCSGIFNATAPEHNTYGALLEKTASILKRKILLPSVPKFIIKIIFGEMSAILLEGSRISSSKISKQGYIFKYHKLGNALHHILKNK